MTRDEPKPRRFRAGRLLAFLGIGLVLLLLLGVLGTRLLLERQGFRGWVLTKLSDRISRDYGIQVSAKDFRLSPLDGRIHVSGVLISASPGAPPFASLETGEATIDLAALKRHRVLAHSVKLKGLTLDLEAPLPSPKPPAGPSAEPPYEIEVTSFELLDGRVKNAPGSQRENQWIESGEASGIQIAGSYVRDTAAFSLSIPELTIVQPGGHRQVLRASAKASVQKTGPFELQDLRVTGDGLDFSGSASGDFTEAASATGRALVKVEPATVVPRFGVDGMYTLDATWDGAQKSGGYVLTAAGASAESFKQWMPPGLFEKLNAAGTDLELTSRGEVQAAFWQPVRGQTHLDWRRGPEKLATLAVTFPEFPEAARPARLVAILELLPQESGTRRASAEIGFSSWKDLAIGNLINGEAEIEAPNLLVATTQLRARWPALVPETALDPRLGGHFTAHATAAGPLQNPRIQGSTSFVSQTGATADAEMSGTISPRRVDGTIRLLGVPLTMVSPELQGSLSATAGIRLRGTEPYANVSAVASDVCFGDQTLTIENVHLEASGTPLDVNIEAFSAVAGPLRLDLSGDLDPLHPWNRTDIRALATFRNGAFSPVNLDATSREGIVRLSLDPVFTRAGLFTARLDLPLGALKESPFTAENSAFLPDGLPVGPARFGITASDVDSCALAEVAASLLEALELPVPPALADLGARPEQLTGALSFAADVDLVEPQRSRAVLSGEGLRAEIPAGSLTTAGILEISLRDGVLKLEPLHLLGGGTQVGVSAQARLSKGLLEGKQVKRAIEWLEVSASGSLESRLIKPFLAGGIPSGPIEMDAEASGAPDQLSGKLKLQGKDLTVVWSRPYMTRLQNISLSATFTGDGLEIENGEATLNGGPVTLAGSMTLARGLDLRAAFSHVRYRLAYGFLGTFGGDLQLFFPWEGRRRLTGNVVMERGVLDREIDLEGELLNRLLAPPEARPTEPGVLDTLDLDIDVTSPGGVRVRNNLADLRAVWNSISVTGTAAEPVIRGQIDIESGGRVYAYQQVFRIDKGAITYTGDAASDPQLDFTTTSSLDDPTITADESRATFSPSSESRTDAVNALATGLATYFGERLTRGIGDALGGARILLRPVLVFGETDPGTQLTVSKDLSRNVLFAFSLDLKNAQRQTYLIDLHGFRGLPSLTTQIFTKEDATYGGTLQQSISFGGSRVKDKRSPRLASLRYDVPKPFLTRAFKRTARLSKGDPVPEEYPFDLEIELASYLRDRGYPEAEVRVTKTSGKKPNTVDLLIEVKPGVRVRFEFEGDQPPKPSRAGLSATYLPGEEEEASLLEIEDHAVRVFRSLGFPEPVVHATARADVEKGQTVRVVTIHSESGRKAPIEKVVFGGVTEEEAAFLAARFSGPAERLELSAGGGGAEKRLLSSLALLGRPAARVLSRQLSPDGKVLSVAIDGGPYTMVADVLVDGIRAQEVERYEKTANLAAGDIARSDRIALGALRIEESLRERGYLKARVRAVIAPASPELVPPVLVRYAVETGEPAILTGINFAGRRFASRSFLERTAGLVVGQPAARQKVDEARSRLFATSIFSSVRSELRTAGDGKAEAVFTVEERPRFSVAYGLRWANSEGFAGVVDILDQNFFGRGITVGVRALYAQDDRSGRFYLASRDLFGSRLDLESFLELRRRYEDGFVNDTTEATLQLSRPFSRKLTGRIYGKYRRTHLFEEIPLDPDFPLDLELSYPYAGSQLIWDTRDDPVFTNRGALATLDVQASGPFISSDFSFLRAFGQVNIYQPLLNWRSGPVTWAQSVRGGWAQAYLDQQLLPDLLFKAGGDSSVRGYPLESLGPNDALFGYLGGSRLVILNEELRFPILSRVSGVLFFDMGSIWNEGNAPRDFLVKSAGIGLRGNTPVGILRGDVAVPLDRREGEPSMKFYFGFGNIF